MVAETWGGEQWIDRVRICFGLRAHEGRVPFCRDYRWDSGLVRV